MSTVTLTGTYGKADINPGSGYVDIVPMVAQANAGVVIVQDPVTATLDGYGTFSVDIIASDDPAWVTPPIPYIFRENIGGRVVQWMAYVNGPGPVDISSLAPLEQAPDLVSYQILAEKGQADGYAPLDGTGVVPAEHLPAGSAPSDHGNLTGLTDPDHPIAAVQGLQAALDLKAPLASPAFTGNPTAPTKPVNTAGTSVATTGFVIDQADYQIDDHVLSVDPHPQYQKESEKGAANGYAPLGADSKVPAANLPDATGGGVTDHGALTGLADDDHPLHPVMVNQPAEPAAPVADRPTLWFDTDAVAEADSTFVRYSDAYLVKAGPFTSLDGTWRPFCTLEIPDAPPGTYRYAISISWIADDAAAGLLLRDRVNAGTWSTYYQQAGTSVYWRNFHVEYPIVRSVSGPVTIELEGRRESGTAYVEAKYVDMYIQRMR